MFTAPTALNAIKREDAEGKYVASGGFESGNRVSRGLKSLFLAAERIIINFYQRTPPCIPSCVDGRIIG